METPEQKLQDELERIQHSGEILFELNKAMSELGVSATIDRLPRDIPQYAPLHEKKVLMADETGLALQHFLPHLMVATKGKASAIHLEQNSTENELAEIGDTIIGKNPDIVLLGSPIDTDGSRTENTSAKLASYLLTHHFGGEVIGFCADGANLDSLTNAGILKFVNRRGNDPEGSLSSVAEAI